MNAVPSVRMTPPALNGFFSLGSTTVMSGDSPVDPLASDLTNAAMADLHQAEVQSGPYDETVRAFAWGTLLVGTAMTAATIYVIWMVLSKG